MLYTHVALLNKNGFNARALHHKKPFKYSWFDSDIPISYLDDHGLIIDKNDILVVPEVNAIDKIPLRINCRKIVFVQGSFLILWRLEKAVGYDELGYEHVMVLMPHMKKIVENHYGSTSTVVPPFIAPYFFAEQQNLNKIERKKQILLFQNPDYKGAGYFDYDIIVKILEKRFSFGNRNMLDKIVRRDDNNWRVVELRGLKHEKVADTMKESAFFVNVNCLEGFNTTVPESMAAGCIPICYEAFGGQDFLKNSYNAYVFQNNYAYPLIDKIFYLIDHYEDLQDELSQIRVNAYNTAKSYSEENLENSLVEFYTTRLS